MLAAASMTLLLGIRWIWMGFLWGVLMLVGWYCKWFGVPIFGERYLQKSVGLWDWQDTTHLEDVPSDKVVDHKSLIISAVGVLFWASMLSGDVITLDREVSLQQDGLIIKAAVINERITTTRNGTSYEVQYRFNPDDQISWYTGSDAITKPDYDLAIAYGTVDVIFLPQNPWINRPLRDASSNSNPVVLLISGLGFFSFGLFALRDSKNYVAQRLGQPSEISWL